MLAPLLNVDIIFEEVEPNMCRLWRVQIKRARYYILYSARVFLTLKREFQ